MTRKHKIFVSLVAGLLLIAFAVTLSQFLTDAYHLHKRGALKMPTRPSVR